MNTIYIIINAFYANFAIRWNPLIVTKNHKSKCIFECRNVNIMNFVNKNQINDIDYPRILFQRLPCNPHLICGVWMRAQTKRRDRTLLSNSGRQNPM